MEVPSWEPEAIEKQVNAKDYQWASMHVCIHNYYLGSNSFGCQDDFEEKPPKYDSNRELYT